MRRPFSCRPGAFPFALLVFALLVLPAIHSASAQTQGPAAIGQGTASVPLPAGVSHVLTIEGVEEYRLANGLQVLLLPDPDKPSVTLNVTYRVGSRHESYGETGMAHLLEHLVFKGTPRHPNIPREMKERGARSNGTTWLDRTNYFATVPATGDNLAWLIDLEADRMVNSFIAKQDLDSEMTVVRNELEIAQNSPSRSLSQLLAATVFKWHNYGKATLGNPSDLENVPIERLQAFYRTYYQPDNATLVIGGQFDVPETLRLIARSFGAIAAPQRQLPRQYTLEPIQEGERSVTLRRSGSHRLISVSWRTMSAAHADAAPLHVLGSVLGDSVSGRLHKALVEPGKVTHARFGWFTGYDPGSATASVQIPKDASIETARASLLEVFDRLRTEPVTTLEVDRAKARYAASFEQRRLDSNSFAILLSEAVASGDWRLTFWARDRIAAVTAEDVNRVAANYFKADNRSIGIFDPSDTPDRTAVPPRADPGPALADYRGAATVTAGEAFDPDLAKLDARTRTREVRPGLKLSLLAKPTRGDRVYARVILRFGDAETLRDQGAVPSAVAGLLTRGTRELDNSALADRLSTLKSTISISGGATGVTADLAAPRANLGEAMRLLVACLREPRFDEIELGVIRRQRLQGIAAAETEPGSIVGERLSSAFNAYPRGHPRYPTPLGERRAELERLDIASVRRFHAAFYGAGKADVAIVGDVSEVAARTLVADLLGDWQSPAPYVRIPAQLAFPPAGNETIEVPGKTSAFYAARIGIPMRDSDPDYPALRLAIHILGGGALDSRLGNRLRQKDGISYSVNAGLSVGITDAVGSLQINATAAPQSMTLADTAIREELERALRDGFTESEVEKARDGYLASRRLSRSSDRALPAYLASNLVNGRTMRWEAEFEARLKAVTAAEATAAFRRHVDANRLLIVKAGTFKGGAPAAVAPAAK